MNEQHYTPGDSARRFCLALAEIRSNTRLEGHTLGLGDLFGYGLRGQRWGFLKTFRQFVFTVYV